MSLLTRAWQSLHPGLDVEVAPDDDIYKYDTHGGRDPQEGFGHYLSMGQEIAELTEQCLAACGLRLAEMSALLDCGAGHGRSTRFLVRRLARERLVVCDAVERAVAFQRERFGVRGVTRVEDLGRERFGAITSWSLFSNLPKSTFVELLRALFERLERGGVLIVSTDSPDGVDGFEYDAQSESSVLGGEVYGASRCSAAWFEELARTLPGVSFVRRAPRALNRCQDVWLLGREREGAGRVFTPAAAPWIEIDAARIEPEATLTVAGWALDHGHAPARELGVLVDAGELIPEVRERSDVAAYFGSPSATRCGFELRHALAGAWPQYLVLRARDSEGRTTLRCKRVAV